LRLGLFIVASDKVIHAFGDLDAKYDEIHQRTGGASRLVERDLKEVKLHLAQLVQAMRADCFERSVLSEAEISRILPFR
jgi:hypothetical protein